MEKNRAPALRNLTSVGARSKEAKEVEIEAADAAYRRLWQALSSLAGRMEASIGNPAEQHAAITHFAREVRELRPPPYKAQLPKVR